MIIIFCVLQSSYKAYNNQCLCSLHHTTTEEAVPFQALPSVLLWLLLNLSLGRVTSSLRHRFTAFIYNKIFKAFSIQSPLNPPLGHTNSNFTFSTFYNHFFLILNFFVILTHSCSSRLLSQQYLDLNIQLCIPFWGARIQFFNTRDFGVPLWPCISRVIRFRVGFRSMGVYKVCNFGDFS